MASAALDTQSEAHGQAGGVPLSWLAAGMFVLLASSQLLLWRFLDFAPWWAYALGVGGIAAIAVHLARAIPPTVISRRALAGSFAVAVLLLLLGGEGRLFYANIDWQVRYAVLHDMASNPWPFVYTARETDDVLRAPIAVFLLPALAFKAAGERAADIVLLLQNTVLIGTLLAMGSTLFATARAKLIALIVIVAFSGMDVIGSLIVHRAISDHLEFWGILLQYSSTITLAFWVPQHAVAAWTGAVAYLLWRDGKLPLGAMAVLMAITPLWSPLGAIGALPFVALAGVQSLLARKLRASDVIWPALTVALSGPALLYLGSAPDEVGARLFQVPFGHLMLFQLVETLPYLIPLLMLAKGARFGGATLWLATICLMAMPLLQIGWSIDFMMRASVTSLTILAVAVADRLGSVERRERTEYWLLGVLAVGSVTGLSEVKRALTFPPAPSVTCSFFKAWDQSFGEYPKGSHLAPIEQMPAIVRPADPYRASAVEPALCWQGAWPRPTGV